MAITDDQKREYSASLRNISFDSEQFAEKRTAELADEFTKLEVQIATILIAFGGLFLNHFTELIPGHLSATVIMIIKLSYAAGILFLVCSLAAGLLHIKRKEKFWDEMIVLRLASFNGWQSVLKGEMTFEEGLAYRNGAKSVVSSGEVLHSPTWTWVLQTIFLSLSILILFILFIVFLFAK